MSGVRGERVACTRRGHTSHLVMLSERHGGCEESNAAGGVAHGWPNADGGGGRGMRGLRSEAQGVRASCFRRVATFRMHFLQYRRRGKE